MERPDRVFVGGGGGALPAILGHAARRLKPGGRFVVTAVTLETVERAADFLRRRGWEREIVLISIARAKDLGELSMFSAHNPVFMITGIKP